MRLTDFEILAVLAQELNMRKAAERLYISQPALSQRLQSIEKAWGQKIFLRSQKGLILTPPGEKIIRYVNETLRREEKLLEELSSLEERVSGTLKLAVASIVGQYWLPGVLKQYVEKYPLVKISLTTGWSSDSVKHLYEDNFHIGIIRGEPEWRGNVYHLFSDELYLVDTTITSLEELKETSRPFIQFKSDSTYYQEIQSWWRKQFGGVPERTIVVDQIETCKQLALNGIGYAILPSISLTTVDRRINKIPLLDDGQQPIQRETWLLSDKTSQHLKQVKAFIDLVTKGQNDEASGKGPVEA